MRGEEMRKECNIEKDDIRIEKIDEKKGKKVMKKCMIIEEIILRREGRKIEDRMKGEKEKIERKKKFKRSKGRRR